MPLLSEAKLNRIRAKLLKTYDGSCQIIRVVSVPDGKGGFRDTTTTLPAFKCRVIAMSYDQERPYADAIKNRLGYKVLVPYGTVIKDTDKLLIDGNILEIIDIVTGQTWELFILVIAARKR